MNKQDKAQLIDELVEKFKSNNFFYITDAGGMSVEQVNNFRSLCYEKGVEYKVVKNKLVIKALEQLSSDFSPLYNTALKGFTGIIFCEDAGNKPAKLLQEYQRKFSIDRPKLKAASIDTDLFIGEHNLDALSNLKSRYELIGDIVALLQSPAKNVVSALQSGQHKLAGIVKTLSDREK